MSTKPMLASDYDSEKVRFPCLAQPKIDGVRALNLFGNLTGRSLKQHANKHVTQYYSDPAFIGLDGEMACDRITHPDLCRITTSALNTISGTPFTQWWLFDYITEETIHLPYHERYKALTTRLTELCLSESRAVHLRIVASNMVHNQKELNFWIERHLEMGFEGTILRDPNGMYKSGRSTVREGGLLRIKEFMDAEAVVIRVVEGNKNTNEQQQNELGQAYRTTHQENIVPNGMVGNIVCRNLMDVKDKSGKILIAKDQEIVVAPGKMSHEERIYWWENQDVIVGKTIKFQFFPKGIKDKPRFPTFQSFRAASDMG